MSIIGSSLQYLLRYVNQSRCAFYLLLLFILRKTQMIDCACMTVLTAGKYSSLPSGSGRKTYPLQNSVTRQRAKVIIYHSNDEIPSGMRKVRSESILPISSSPT